MQSWKGRKGNDFISRTSGNGTFSREDNRFENVQFSARSAIIADIADTAKVSRFTTDRVHVHSHRVTLARVNKVHKCVRDLHALSFFPFASIHHHPPVFSSTILRDRNILPPPPSSTPSKTANTANIGHPQIIFSAERERERERENSFESTTRPASGAIPLRDYFSIRSPAPRSNPNGGENYRRRIGRSSPDTNVIILFTEKRRIRGSGKTKRGRVKETICLGAAYLLERRWLGRSFTVSKPRTDLGGSAVSLGNKIARTKDEWRWGIRHTTENAHKAATERTLVARRLPVFRSTPPPPPVCAKPLTRANTYQPNRTIEKFE